MPLKKFFSRKKKDEEDKEEDNPFAQPTAKSKGEDKASFRYYVKGVFSSFGQRLSSNVGFFGRKKIHIRFLRQSKYVVACGLMFLYFAMALVSFPNPFFLLFLSTAYLMLDYLWKSRRVEWKKEK